MSKDSTDTKQRASTEHRFVDCAAKPEISDGSSFPATVRVLVVDDELFMRRFLERLLARWGYDVSTAQDGNTALALVRNTPFDLILLDVRMPEMSGVHVCEELRTFSDAVVTCSLP